MQLLGIAGNAKRRRCVAIQVGISIVRRVPGKLRRDGRVVEGARLERV